MRSEQLAEQPVEQPADDCAPYLIRIAGRVGPVLLCLLRQKAVVHQETSYTLVIPVLDTDEAEPVDLVDVARRGAACGLEIESLRFVGTRAP